ncbi:MAG: hypothetical protein OEO23_06385 [Gemmatimonadota bacterium]|nr:hypothetical protein [Gemmatimonadota bacterium]
MCTDGLGCRPRVLGLLLALTVVGCEIQEITIAEREDIVIAEAHLVVTRGFLDMPGGPQATTTMTARVFLHRTFPGNPPIVPATVVVRAPGGAVSLALPQVGQEACRLFFLAEGQIPPPSGSCYRLELSPSPIPPGAAVELDVLTDDGRRLTSTSTIPGDFELVGLESGMLDLPGGRLQRQCLVRPGTRLRVAWTSSAEAWGYLGETVIVGLDEAIPEVDVPQELYLNGLALRGDTTIVLPSDFLVFERFDLDREISLALQEGMPLGTSAVVSISSLDRNWVNWARGGNFNPSGAVRIPSVFGEGTGVFGTAVRHEFMARALDDPATLAQYPNCGPPEP